MTWKLKAHAPARDCKTSETAQNKKKPMKVLIYSHSHVESWSLSQEAQGILYQYIINNQMSCWPTVHVARAGKPRFLKKNI